MLIAIKSLKTKNMTFRDDIIINLKYTNNFIDLYDL